MNLYLVTFDRTSEYEIEQVIVAAKDVPQALSLGKRYLLDTFEWDEGELEADRAVMLPKTIPSDACVFEWEELFKVTETAEACS
jgi:hypothetical protein